MLISPEHGVLTPGAAPPVFEADYWPVPVKVAGTAASGQMMVIDQADMVYRLISGRVPAPVWRVNSCHQRVGVVGLPGRRLPLVVAQCPLALPPFNDLSGFSPSGANPKPDSLAHLTTQH